MAAALKRESLNLRIRPELRSKIDRAAALKGKTRTEFVLEAAQRAADEALLDQTLFEVSESDFQAFLDRLDEPPAPNERLRRLMHTRPPWEDGGA